MRLTAAVGFAAALFCTATPVLAQDETFPGKEFGAWSVYSEGGDCWMEKDIGGGTVVFIQTVFNEQMLNFGAVNPAWKDFKEGGDVDGHIAVGSVSVESEGLGLENGFTMYTVLPSGTALDTISSARAVTLKGGDKTVSFSLANTRDAMAYLKACDAKIKRD
jgi:hypothetical protein